MVKIQDYWDLESQKSEVVKIRNGEVVKIRGYKPRVPEILWVFLYEEVEVVQDLLHSVPY